MPSPKSAASCVFCGAPITFPARDTTFLVEAEESVIWHRSRSVLAITELVETMMNVFPATLGNESSNGDTEQKSGCYNAVKKS